MIHVPNRTTPPLSRNTLSSLNQKCTLPIGRDTVLGLNQKPQSGHRGTGQRQFAPQRPDRQPSGFVPPRQGNPSQVPQSSRIQPEPQPVAPNLVNMLLPVFHHSLRKGQKTLLDPQNRGIRRIKVCFGWNVKDQRCDIDASAFLVNAGGHVPGDEWFVFYGQNASPDHSVVFSHDATQKDREIIRVDFGRMNPSVQKIVFVLTINEAYEKQLNFSMIEDAYIRLLDDGTDQEIVSYRLEEYYEKVISMTIGELYLHNGQWKFNPVGNGVHQDLAGQCAIYGVEIG